MSQINAQRVGELAVVTGPGFEFHKAGDQAVFKQTGKVPSLRAAKAFCKMFTS
ncbi:hypothetical protein [Pseudomonas sp. CM27]|uniref:hypothetical protein n=1 Tax=Pseudomonas sp. CM27 TaxID=2738452 RepID=UPI001553F907|nr:hypothetical protein [Pseudomonas sp. CM27]NQD74127.1 hypothetical protein [Pseudomonas sp. CM27]